MTVKHRDDLDKLIFLLAHLIETQNGKKITDDNLWLGDAQILSVKFFRHVATVGSIARGTVIEFPSGGFVKHVDHSSIKVVTRAALETFLVFHYIFCCESDDLSKFRHATWQMCGYMDRQSTKASTEKHKQQLREEKEYIEQLANFIKASDFFCGLNANERKGIMKGNWRAGNSWGSLGEQAGFHRVYFDNIYSFLCGYSHTSFISALQVKQSQMLEDQGFLAGTILGFASKIISHFIFSYCDVFPGACKFLDNEDGIRKIANKWCFSADEMDDFYHDKT